VLVGRNVTRRSYNQRLRQLRGFEGDLPQAGDKLVCLRNNRRKGLLNGSLWTVKERRASKSALLSMRIASEDDPAQRHLRVTARPECFVGGIEDFQWAERKPYDEFDFGSALTVHKAQGSQWDDVVLFDESFAFQESRARWLYTGVTRAAKRLCLVV
jgi:exodeoxyribonuclease-5